MTGRLPVYLEIGAKRVFAGAVEWPGWCRGGRDEAAALDALLAYRDRYAAVVARAGLPLPEPGAISVTERLPGTATTDFGAPGVAPAADDRPLSAEELARQTRLLVACWDAFDDAVARARAAARTLRTGPRGGGRDVEAIAAHVADAEAVYLGKLGARPPRSGGNIEQREAILAALAARAHGEPVADPSKVQRPWSPRYFVRRAAWHVLDHAWEIEDRAED